MGNWIAAVPRDDARMSGTMLSAYIESLPFKDTTKFAGELSHLLKREAPWLLGDNLPCMRLLPIISPNPLHLRFHVERITNADVSYSGVHLIVRKAYAKLKQVVLKREERKGIYLHGASGIGKSSLLYTLVTDLRIQRVSEAGSRIRVTYINDCGAWVHTPYTYLLNELVITFANDSLDIDKWAENIVVERRQYDCEKNLRMLIEMLIAYVRRQKIEWFVIIDQLNSLFKTPNPLYDEFPFSIIDMLATSNVPNILVSASANNSAFPAEFQNWEKHDLDVLPVRYDEKEFDLWTQRLDHRPSSDMIRQIMYWTGAIPLELDIFQREGGSSHEEKLSSYKKSRLQALIASHRKFFCGLSNEADKASLRECVGRLALNLPPPDNLAGMDRQLLFIVSEGKKRIRARISALNPICRDALLAYHSDTLESTLHMVAEAVFADTVNYTNDVKGRAVKRYIISMLSKRRFYSFDSTDSAGSAAKFEGSIEDVVHFDGDGLPIKSTIRSEKTTLIVPTSAQFPGIDFVIWDPTGKLIAVQVTIRKSLKGHMTGCRFRQELWARFMRITTKQIVTLWMAPEGCIDVKDRVQNTLNNYIARLESLEELCPMIRKLRRCGESEEDTSTSDDEGQEAGDTDDGPDDPDSHGSGTSAPGVQSRAGKRSQRDRRNLPKRAKARTESTSHAPSAGSSARQPT